MVQSFEDIEFLLRGILVGISISIPLGPIGVMVVQRTIIRGNWAGFFSGLGAALSDLVYALIAGFGFSLVLDFIKEHQSWLQVGGGAVLFMFGVNMFLQNPIRQLRAPRKQNVNYWQDVVSSFFLTFSNPLAVFTFLIIFANFNVFAKAQDSNTMIYVLIGVFIGALMWWANLTFWVGKFRGYINIRRLWWINKISGVTIGLIAIGVILQAFL